MMPKQALSRDRLKPGKRVSFHRIQGVVVAIEGPWPIVQFDGDEVVGPILPELLTLVAPPEPLEFYEGPLEVGDHVFYKQGWRGSGQGPWVVKERCEVNQYVQVISVDRIVVENGRPFAYKPIFPVPEKSEPQIGGEFVLQRGHVVYYRGASHGVVATEITNALNYREILRVEALDGKVLWKRHDSKTGAPPATAS